MDFDLPTAFIFMKVGSHAGETFETIMERKQREYDRAGKIFWGYGGTTLHPTKHVQPFVKSWIQNGGEIQLVMEPINSKADPDVLPAREYSADGITWEPIPLGIEVTGSRYAVVLDEIKPGTLDLDLAGFEVGVGPSRGKNAANYVKGRVDKGCFVAADSSISSESVASPRIVPIRFQARLLEPYAVMLRH